LGWANLTQADSLYGNQDFLQVAPTTQPSAYGLEFAKLSKKKAIKETDNTDTPPATAFDDGKDFVQIYTGYDFSFLEDIVNGSNAWVSAAKSEGYTVTGGGNNSGIEAGALFGLRLDPSNSLALDLGGVFTFANNWTAASASNTTTQACSPELFSASLDYILDIVKNPGSHTYLTVGAGWYHASVSDDVQGGGTAYSGTFTGDTIGGALGVGEEVALGSSVGLDFSVKARYASFGKVSSTSAKAAGSGSGSSSLAIVNESGYSVLAPVYDSEIGPSTDSRDAVVDYSGIDAKVALNIYFN
jgi:hypothetical protein